MPVPGPAARPGSPGEPGRHPLACPGSGLPGGPPRRAPAAGSGRGAPAGWPRRWLCLAGRCRESQIISPNSSPPLIKKNK